MSRVASPLKVSIAWSLSYIALGALWISLSDVVVSRLDLGSLEMVNMETYKGWAYVALTGLLVFAMLFSSLSRQGRLYEELEEREGRLSEFLSSLPGMTYECRSDGDWTMIFVSDYCYELTGFTPNEVVGNRVWDGRVDSPEYFRPIL